MSYPKFVVGNNSKSLFKMFSPTLGIALTRGCMMDEGVIIKSEHGTHEVPYDLYKAYDVDVNPEAVQAAADLGQYKFDLDRQSVVG